MTAILITAAVAGAVYALAAMGLVLTYRVSGIFNFAHGAMGMFVAYCYWQLNSRWGIPVLPALVLTLGVVGPVLAVLAERLFRPLKHESMAVQVVVSLGVLVFLQNLAVVLFGQLPQRLDPIFPVGTIRLGDVRIGYDQIGTVAVAIALSVALTALLRRTALGLRMRAVVDNEGLAELAGVSAPGVARLSWLIGVTFAGLGGILLSPFLGLDVNLLTLLVITTYAAAMLGRLESLPLAWLGGLLLALGEQLVTRYAPRAGALIGLRSSLSFFLLFALLIVYGRRLPTERKVERIRIDEAGMSAERRMRLGTLAVGAAALVLVPLLASDQQLYNLNAVVVTAVILVSLVVLTGFSGQVSICQASFVGVGAFTAGHIVGADGGNFLLALVAAVAIAVPVGVVVGLPSLRLSGLFLALATMAFALLMDSFVFEIDAISGGERGMNVSVPRIFGISFAGTRAFYVLSVIFLVAFATLATTIRRGRLGRRLQALRDSPDALRTLGVNLVTTRLSVFALSAAMAAAAGVLFASYRGHIATFDFRMFTSVGFLVVAVLGGIDSIGGAVVGAFILTFPQLIQGLQQGTSNVNDYLGLAIGLNVMLLARYPNGLISYTAEQARRIGAVLRPSVAPVPRAEVAP